MNRPLAITSQPAAAEATPTHTPTPVTDPDRSPQILRIEPDIQTLVLSAGSKVKLQLEVFGLQNQRDDSLADGASPDDVSFEWCSSDPAAEFTESTNHQIRRNQQPDDRTVLYTASEAAVQYTVTAELDRTDECAGMEGAIGAPSPTPVLTPTPETLEPETGGTVIPYSSTLLIAIFGVAILTLGIAILWQRNTRFTN